MSARVWYFAYGSNMQPATFAGRRGITPSQALAARAPGWRLTLDKTPIVPVGASFANLLAEPAAATWGVLYEIGSDDLDHLDLTEGVLIGNYVRVEIAVEPHGAPGPTRAFTLVSDKRSADLQPSDRYMQLLIEGAETHGLPPDWIAMLRAIPTCAESPEAMAGRRIVDAGLAGMRRRDG
jgi:cation transport regulator ChaC